MNKRTEIRTAFVTLLQLKLPSIPNISGSRHRLISKDELPFINVYCGNETARIFNASPRLYLRELEIVIDIYYRSKEDIDAALEALMSQVETIIGNEDRFTLENVVDEIYYTSASIAPDGREAIQETGVASLRYNVTYQSSSGVPIGDLTHFNNLFADFGGKASTELTDIF